MQGLREEWQVVFFITAGVYAVGTVVYGIFASGEEQKWARDPIEQGKPSQEVTWHDVMWRHTLFDSRLILKIMWIYVRYFQWGLYDTFLQHNYYILGVVTILLWIVIEYNALVKPMLYHIFSYSPFSKGEWIGKPYIC